MVAAWKTSHEVTGMQISWGSNAGFEERRLSQGRLYVATPEKTPSVLFVHGGFHGAWCWSQMMSYARREGTIAAAIDLRGHGGLPQDETYVAQGVDAMTQDVLEATRGCTGDLVLVGHSLGALIAMKAAMECAPRGLVLLAPARPANVSEGQSLPVFPEDRATPAPGEERARKWFLSGSSASDLSGYVSLLCAESPRLLNECFHEGVAIDRNLIPCPILCLSGGKDDSPLHRRGQDQAIAEAYGADLQVIARSGHCMMLDDGWQDAAAAIEAWTAALPRFVRR